MNTMTVKDVINLSHGKIEVRFTYDGENHFIKLLSDDISKLKHCVNKVNSMWAVSYTFCIYAEGTPKFESDNIEEKTDMKRFVKTFFAKYPYQADQEVNNFATQNNLNIIQITSTIEPARKPGDGAYFISVLFEKKEEESLK